MKKHRNEEGSGQEWIYINRFRGRKREEQSKKSQAVQIYQIYEKEGMYAWEMHEHVTCKLKSITGSAQSNPIST